MPESYLGIRPFGAVLQQAVKQIMAPLCQVHSTTVVAPKGVTLVFTSREAAWSCRTVGKKKSLLLFWMLLPLCLVIFNNFNKFRYLPLIFHNFHWMMNFSFKKLYNLKILWHFLKCWIYFKFFRYFSEFFRVYTTFFKISNSFVLTLRLVVCKTWFYLLKVVLTYLKYYMFVMFSDFFVEKLTLNHRHFYRTTQARSYQKLFSLHFYLEMKRSLKLKLLMSTPAFNLHFILVLLGGWNGKKYLKLDILLHLIKQNQVQQSTCVAICDM